MTVRPEASARPVAPELNLFGRIMLGTAQLGMRYGIANSTGCPDEDLARALVQGSAKTGIMWFDTAAGYGESELVLGRAFSALGLRDSAYVVSKGNVTSANGRTLRSQVAESLRRLGLSRLDAWLVHDENQLSSWGRAESAEARALVGAGQVGLFGLSAYSPEAALRALQECPFGCLQFPASPLDRRFLRPRVADRLVEAGAALYIRSVYLQGLCLMEPSRVPASIFRGREAVGALRDFCAGRGLETDYFCLHYVLQRTAAMGARVVVGLETMEQLARNAAILRAPGLDPAYLSEWDALWPEDLDELVLPYRWKLRP